MLHVDLLNSNGGLLAYKISYVELKHSLFYFLSNCDKTLCTSFYMIHKKLIKENIAKVMNSFWLPI